MGPIRWMRVTLDHVSSQHLKVIARMDSKRILRMSSLLGALIRVPIHARTPESSNYDFWGLGNTIGSNQGKP